MVTRWSPRWCLGRPILAKARFGVGRSAPRNLAWADTAVLVNRLARHVFAFFVAFTTGIVAVFTTVASGAYLPSLVPREKLLFANSKLSIVSTATETAGQVGAGLIVSVIRAPSAIIIEILCALGASCMIASTREDSRIADNNGTPTNFRRELKEGISYTFAHPLFRTILTTNVMWNVAMAGQFAIAVPFLLDSIGIDALMIGIVFALGGVGGLVGALVVTPFANKFGSGFVWRSALILGPILGLLVPMSCFSHGVFGATLFGVGSAVLSAAIALVSVITATARQTACPPEMLGRLGAVSQFVTWSAIPLSALIFGAVGSLFGLPFAMWLVAATFFACPLIARSSPLWRAVNIATVVA